MSDTLPAWAKEYDVAAAGFRFAGATAVTIARDAGAAVLLLEKAPEPDKGSNRRVAFGRTAGRNAAAEGSTRRTAKQFAAA